MKLIIRPTGLKRNSRQAGLDGWSDELLAQVDNQLEAWERIYRKLAANNARLGMSGMTRYSPKERAQLAILVQNMEEFAPLVGGRHGRKVTQLYQEIERLLADYDDFCNEELCMADFGEADFRTLQ